MVTPEDLQTVLNFIGYGNLEAPLWFIGKEEGVGKPLRTLSWSLDRELQTRATWSPVMDMFDAHRTLRNIYWVDLEFPWKLVLISRLARGILHLAPDWSRSDKGIGYVLNHLGLATSETLLGEALPLPHRYREHWPHLYKQLYPSRKEYEQAVMPKRFAMWRELIEEHRPQTVICYGLLWYYNRDKFIDHGWISLNRRVTTTMFNQHTRVYIMPVLDRDDRTDEDSDAVIRHATQGYVGSS